MIGKTGLLKSSSIVIEEIPSLSLTVHQSYVRWNHWLCLLTVCSNYGVCVFGVDQEGWSLDATRLLNISAYVHIGLQEVVSFIGSMRLVVTQELTQWYNIKEKSCTKPMSSSNTYDTSNLIIFFFVFHSVTFTSHHVPSTYLSSLSFLCMYITSYFVDDNSC